MEFKPGARFISTACTAQAAIVRPPNTEGVITCGGAPMVALGTPAAGPPTLTAPQEGQALAGKRYFDEASGLEVLCTKGGFGAFAFNGRPLPMKEAKRLPASD
jgi:hypothetical protein